MHDSMGRYDSVPGTERELPAFHGSDGLGFLCIVDQSSAAVRRMLSPKRRPRQGGPECTHPNKGTKPPAKRRGPLRRAQSVATTQVWRAPAYKAPSTGRNNACSASLTSDLGLAGCREVQRIRHGSIRDALACRPRTLSGKGPPVVSLKFLGRGVPLRRRFQRAREPRVPWPRRRSRQVEGHLAQGDT